MKVTKQREHAWDDDAFKAEFNGHERQMLLGALEAKIYHHRNKAKKLKTAGSKKEHERTALNLYTIYLKLQKIR